MEQESRLKGYGSPPPLPAVELAEEEVGRAPACGEGGRKPLPAAPQPQGSNYTSNITVWWPLCAAVLVTLLVVLITLVAYLASSHASLVRELRYIHGIRAGNYGAARWT